MLKRYQVLLEEWQADYIKRISHKNISFAQAVRLIICAFVLEVGEKRKNWYKVNGFLSYDDINFKARKETE